MGMLTPGTRVPTVSMSITTSVYIYRNVNVSVTDYNTTSVALWFCLVQAASVEGILVQLLQSY